MKEHDLLAIISILPMVSVAQWSKAPGCGPGYRGFKSLHSPHDFPIEGFYIILILLQLKYFILTSQLKKTVGKTNINAYQV